MPNFLRRYTWIRKEDANKNMAGAGRNGQARETAANKRTPFARRPPEMGVLSNGSFLIG